MQRAVHLKFAASAELRCLLLVSSPHPLLSIKPDEYWGVSRFGEGANRLAELLMELREGMVAASQPPGKGMEREAAPKAVAQVWAGAVPGDPNEGANAVNVGDRC